ncbi:enoyl-CoA hydratase/isomerase family protein [Streptomyces sp. G44]|uniref:enoyl-CoA-hydratase DpgB n=1 Tax=Streptomyces sp. G44 TaxID=2807632 RepID=UPI0019608477|nr:enoyl-CoA-hydratase DpgB [Streptomyces sp. G44]MBM7169923.1 enoyl-CoA hydratase/isomerase family protein [Streptomyces sp. G44]
MKPLRALELDGSEPLSATAVKAVADLCDRVEDTGGCGSGPRPGPGIAAVRVTGAPAGDGTDGLDVMLVTKWERAVRRLERLPAVTVAVARGDCGGTALDAFPAGEVGVGAGDTRLVVPRDATATWPGMAAYRLAHLAGAARVRKAVLFGRPIEAAEALALGIADELTDDPAAAVSGAAALADGLSGKELAIRRQLLFDAATTTFEDALGAHLAACDRALRRQGTGQEVTAP